LPANLVPVDVTHSESRQLKVNVLNAGSTRQTWTPGKTWRVRSSCMSCLAEAVQLKPGELAELLLELVE